MRNSNGVVKTWDYLKDKAIVFRKVTKHFVSTVENRGKVNIRGN